MTTIPLQRYFDGLASEGLWSGNMADTIALLFVYMPIVRKEIYNFVDLWNAHRIRAQPSCPTVAAGKPVVLYFNPPARNGVPIDDYGQAVPMEHFDRMQSIVAAYSMLSNSVSLLANKLTCYL